MSLRTTKQIARPEVIIPLDPLAMGPGASSSDSKLHTCETQGNWEEGMRENNKAEPLMDERQDRGWG